MSYCQPTDLLLGQIPTPTGLSVAKVVSDAADEIDSCIGLLYQTPVDTNAVSRPVKLLLKRLNVFLATGRLILAVTSNEEDARLNAYGLSLVQEAQKALYAIAEGAMVLTGAAVVPGNEPQVSTPLINNLDAESNVEAFYNRVANPNYLYPPFPGGSTGSVFL